MRTRKKIWFLYSLIPIVIAIVVGIGIYTREFGMFSPKEPYVKGEPDSIALDSVKERTGLAKWVPERNRQPRMCRPAKEKKEQKIIRL